MIDALSSFHFIRPFFLALLLPAFLLWYFQRALADRSGGWQAVIAPELLRHLLTGAEGAGRLTPNALLLAAWILGVVAVAGPAWQREPSPFAEARPPVMVVLKVTPSMQSTDVAPTRLDRARQKLSDLMALREGASTGLVAYAGSPHLVLPPTADGKVILAMAGALDPSIMPKEGDDLAGAVGMARRVLADGGHGGSIFVIADTASEAETTLLAQTDVPAGHVPVLVLAVLPPDPADADSHLREAAAALDAQRVDITVDRSDVRQIAGRLDKADQAGSVAGEGEHWKDAGYWFAMILVPLTLAWFRRGWVLP